LLFQPAEVTEENFQFPLTAGFIVHEARFFVPGPFCTSAKQQPL
jgi:hypothetical protein